MKMGWVSPWLCGTLIPRYWQCDGTLNRLAEDTGAIVDFIRQLRSVCSLMKFKREGTTMAHIDHDAFTRDTAGQANLAADEERILRFLGAAVIMQWNTLPTKLQRELFDKAASMGDLMDPIPLKGQIALVLASTRG